MSEYDHPRFGIPNQSPFDVQWSKPSPVLTQKEQRAVATIERNRASARKRSAEILAAKKAAKEHVNLALDSRGRATVGMAPRSRAAISIGTQSDADKFQKIKRGTSS